MFFQYSVMWFFSHKCDIWMGSFQLTTVLITVIKSLSEIIAKQSSATVGAKQACPEIPWCSLSAMEAVAGTVWWHGRHCRGRSEAR